MIRFLELMMESEFGFTEIRALWPMLWKWGNSVVRHWLKKRSRNKFVPQGYLKTGPVISEIKTCFAMFLRFIFCLTRNQDDP